MICGLPDDEFMKRYFVATEKLRRFEGDTVELVADDGEHDSRVICMGGWTNGAYEPESFTGVNILLALEAAVAIWADRYRNENVPESRLGDTDWDGEG